MAIVVRAVRPIQLHDLAQGGGLVGACVGVGAVVSAGRRGKHLLLAGLALHDPIVHGELGDVPALYVRCETRRAGGRVVQGRRTTCGKLCEGPLVGEGISLQVIGTSSIQLDRNPVGHGDRLAAHRNGLSRLGLEDFKGNVDPHRFQGPVVDRQPHHPDSRLVWGENGLAFLGAVFQNSSACLGGHDDGEEVVQRVAIDIRGIRAIQDQWRLEDRRTFQGQHCSRAGPPSHHQDIHHVGDACDPVVVRDGKGEGVHAIPVWREDRVGDPCIGQGGGASFGLADNAPDPTLDLAIRVT